MPKTNSHDEPISDELPETLKKSDRKAQDTFAKTYDSAMEQYGDAQRASQTAYAQLKHTHEKVGDHWEEKEEYGDSDERAESSERGRGSTAGGVNANASKEHLYQQAQELGIEGRSHMTKDELVEALHKESQRQTSGS
ncbi:MULTISPECIES: ChaB family protein [Kocuria]|uniref:ChaB family protein n=1 Tax=Kocuria TaxID=57493 RepID=UPI000661236C|nr:MULTISPECIES: ChaB family protein [Kocuria]MCT1367674.1 ChaB family protein [Rothia sp. p3-SID1597]RUQ20235.1 cation transport regulator ChaB [Kocuria sp. HSID16901]